MSAELQNFDRAVEAADASLNSENSTMRQNAEYQKGLEYSVSQLKAQFEEFVLGNGGLQATAKIFINLVTGTLSLINALGGLKTVLLTLATIIATVKADNIVKFFTTMPKLISNVVGFITVYNNALAEGKVKSLAFAEAQEAIGITASKAQLAIGGLLGILTAFVAVFSLVNNAIEKHNQEIEQARNEAVSLGDSIRSEISAIEEAINKINDESITREGITDILKSNIEGYETEEEALDSVTKARQRAIDKLNEEAKAKVDAWMKTNEALAKSDIESLKQVTQSDIGATWLEYIFGSYGSGGGVGIEFANNRFGNPDDFISNAEAIKRYDEEIKKLTDDFENLSGIDKIRLEHLQNERNALYNTTEAQEANVATYLYMKSVLSGLDSDLEEYNNFCKESVTQQDKIKDSTDDLNNALEDIKNSYGYTKEQLIEYAEANDMATSTAQDWYDVADAMLAAGESAGVLEENIEQINALGDTLSGLEDDYNSLSTAIADFNDGNGISAANLDKLIELARQHADAISFDNGQIKLNEEAFQASANAAINDAEAKLIDETQTRLTAVAQGNLGEALEGMGNAATNAGAKSDSARVIIQALGDDASISAAKIRDLWNALDGTDVTGYTDAQKKAVEEIGNYFTTAMNGMESYRKQINTSYSSTAKSAAKSSKSAAKESKDAWLEAYKEEKDAIDSMYKTGILNAEEYSAKLQGLADKYFLDSEAHQKKYAKELRSLYEEMYKALQKAAKESLDEMKRAHKQAEDAMKKAHKTQEDNLKKSHEEEERRLKKAHEAQEKAIKEQIELLKRQKDAIKDSYNAQIEALKREREEYENQLKLMQLKEELAKAQQKYMYVMDETGRFNYVQDQNAVDQAKEELYEEELKQAYERQLQDLEDARDAAVELYEQQIQDLEDYYDRVKEINDEAEEELKLRNDEAEEELKRHNDAQEDALSAHNDEIERLYEKAIEDYNTYAEILNNGQLNQINSENSNWATRLSNLASFVNNYNNLLNKLGDGSTGNSGGGSFSGGSGYTKTSGTVGGSKSSSSGRGGNSAVNAANSALKANEVKRALNTSVSNMASALTKSVKSIFKHAQGIAKIDTDEIALVGDSPNQELAIGSRLNGVPLSLESGSGVVNAKSTRTLAGLLNSIPNLGNNYGTTNNSNQQTIHIDNINLPQVQNGSEFISYLENFDINMIQNSYLSI